jgi:hypothetical protein
MRHVLGAIDRVRDGYVSVVHRLVRVADARVVDHDVDAAEAGGGGRDEPRHVGGTRDIGRAGERQAGTATQIADRKSKHAHGQIVAGSPERNRGPKPAVSHNAATSNQAVIPVR